jgi:tetratricopeptide (TPR) repeat protein
MALDLTIDDIFNPSAYGGKLFKVTPAKVKYGFRMEVDENSPEGKYLAEKIEPELKKQTDAFRKEKEELYKSALKATENNMIKTLQKKTNDFKDAKSLENWMNEELKGVHVMISNAMKTFESLVLKKTEEIFNKVIADFEKKAKKAVSAIKWRAAVKIVTEVGIVLASTAVAVAATASGIALAAATHGAGAASFAVIIPAVLGLLVTSGKSTLNIVQILMKSWPSHKTTMTNLEKALTALQKAVEYSNKKAIKKQAGQKLGPKETLKLVLTDVAGEKKKALALCKDADAWAATFAKNIEKMHADVSSLEESLADLSNAAKSEKDSKVAKEMQKQADAIEMNIKSVNYNITNSRNYLEKLMSTMKEVDNAIDKYIENPNMFGAVIGKIQGFIKDDTVQQLINTAGPVVKATQTLVSNLSKIAQAAH